jgi:quercetin dioxygenase-like cupin family protein
LGPSIVAMAALGGAYALTTQPAPGAAAQVAPATASSGTHVVLQPKDLKWVDGPTGLPKGSKVAVLEGDPSKPGPYTIRTEFPAGYKIMPHTHPVIEHITVISGEFYVGSGDKLSEEGATKLGEGGYAVMPIQHVHYAFTKDKKSIVQLHGVGPWGITYVNPADDPRNQAAPRK